MIDSTLTFNRLFHEFVLTHFAFVSQHRFHDVQHDMMKFHKRLKSCCDERQTSNKICLFENVFVFYVLSFDSQNKLKCFTWIFWNNFRRNLFRDKTLSIFFVQNVWSSFLLNDSKMFRKNVLKKWLKKIKHCRKT